LADHRSSRRTAIAVHRPETRRARYTAGRIGERNVPSYVDEEGVDPKRDTETFAQLALELHNERWAGTTFLLRAGKAMRSQRKGAVVRFRPATDPGLGQTGDAPRSELWIGVDGPENVALTLTGQAAGPPGHSAPIVLTGEPPSGGLGAYGHVLLDVLTGSSLLSVGGDEAEAAWQLVTPILRGGRVGRSGVGVPRAPLR
jgi:glucose-6-phosphate 1-dehydrogenase